MLILFLIFLQITYSVTANYVEPLQTARHITIYRSSDYQKNNHLTQPKKTSYGFGESRFTIIEYPTNDTIPVDTGGNFGDIEVDITEKDGELLGRDTIVNAVYPYDIVINYRRTYEGYYAKDLKILNFGRQRGWPAWTAIIHGSGTVETELLVRAGDSVRMFAEVYGHSLD